MLSKTCCPHTGVVNYFFDTDPHLAVGSIVKGEGVGYQWRCYTDPCAEGGTVPDLSTAERRIADLCHKAAGTRFARAGRLLAAARRLNA